MEGARRGAERKSPDVGHRPGGGISGGRARRPGDDVRHEAQVQRGIGSRGPLHALEPGPVERAGLRGKQLLLEPAQRLRGEKELRRKIQNVEALRDLFLPNRAKP